jgi:hypothetical protein
MVVPIDERYYDVEEDRVINIYENTIVPFFSFSRSYVVNKRYDYPADTLTVNDLTFNDIEL